MYNYFEKLNNVKITKSHIRLHFSFIELLGEKELDKLTVNDICEDAMVSRATFYNYFDDKYHLLWFSIYYFQSEIIKAEELLTTVDKDEAIHIILSDINRNRQLLRNVLKFQDTTLIIKIIHDLTEPHYEKMLKYYEDQGHNLIVSIEFLSEFFSGAFTSIIIKWLLDNNPKSIEELSLEIDTVTNFKLYTK